MQLNTTLALGALMVLFFTSCGSTTSKKATPKATESSKPTFNSPTFHADSAYEYVAKQVEFGPRVPNSEAHAKCADYLSTKLSSFGAEVKVQRDDVKGYKTTYHMKNVIGSFNPTSPKRIMLCAHWDSRAYADHDPDKNKQHDAILGANDGASGVGVLLEIARQLQAKQANVGVDIVLFDIEDQGIPRFDPANRSKDYWCLGSQYWSTQASKDGYKAEYGILLDMVGAPDAQFYFEQVSVNYASFVVNHVWDIAAQSGYGKYFIQEKGGMITDDHLFVNQIANIPCIDIIQHDKNTQTGFGYYWHTHMDNMDAIDKSTLKAVGQTLLNVIYSE